MAVGDIIRTDVHFTFQGNPNIYCFAFRVIIPAPALDDEDNLLDWWETEGLVGVLGPPVKVGFDTLHDNTVVFNCLVAQKIANALTPTVKGVSLEVTKTIGINGTLSGLSLPGQNSFMLQTLPLNLSSILSTERGRNFHTGLHDTDQIDGVWTQAASDKITKFYGDWFLGDNVEFGSAEYEYINWSATTHAKNVSSIPPSPLVDAWNAVEHVRGLKSVKTQRRRQHENPCDKYFDTVDT